jgi:two-component system, cell cycle sensor histidine kinase and response regulator CckA
LKASRILVVEDDRILAMSLQSQLRKLGYEVPVTVHTGEDAIRRAAELQPQLVLMDIQLQGAMDGVEAAGVIHARFRIPVIYLTAYSTPEILERAKITAPSGYILKPYEDRELHINIECALTKDTMERRLEERERWLAATLMSMGDGVVAIDNDARIIFLNPMGERLTGWNNDEAKGRLVEEVVRLAHEVSGQPVESPLRKALREGKSTTLGNHIVLVAKDSTELPLDDSAAPIFDSMGTTLGGVMVFRDVSERKMAETVVAKLAAIVSGSEDAIIGLDLKGDVTSWNPGAERLYGYSAGEMMNRPIDILFPPDGQEEFKTIAGRLEAGVRMPAAELTMCRKDAKKVTVMVSFSPIKNLHGRVIGAASIAHDITQTKRLEDQFRQAQKMEAIGRLAGGVAHDFNNLLTVINGYSSILSVVLHDHDKAREMVDQISRAGERAASLTQRLLAYSRKQILQPKVLDLNELLRSAAKMLSRVIGEDTDLVFTLSPQPCLVKADPGQLELVVMNLAVNGRDAMAKGGKLTIETATIELSNEYVDEYAEVRAGPYTMLAVTDGGTGMDAETLTHIFEPFFTTKEEGKSTGLGLATVYGIVKQSGGHIRVYSELDRGTTFKVYLPRVGLAFEEEEPKPIVPEFPTGSETVLLVEDEDGVRKLTSFLLKRAGYNLLEASNGVEALEIASRHEGSIDLLITDVVMPRMGGRELADALRSFNPHLKVLFLSGYTADAIVRHGILGADSSFLQKPYTMSVLACKIREVFGK